MDEDDFGDLYGAPAPIASAIAASTSQTTYAFYDDEDDDETFGDAGPAAPRSSIPPIPSVPKAPSVMAEAKNRSVEPVAERDSDEDDDLLLLGYNSKSGASSGKLLQAAAGVDMDRRLSDIPTAKVPLSNGGAVTSFASSQMPSILPGIRSLSRSPGKTPGINVFTDHAISIPGLSTTVNASTFDIRESEELPEDGWEQRQVGGEAPEDAATDKGATTGKTEDWDTDSEDDLQIVLGNEYNYYSAPVEKTKADTYEGGSEDEEEDLIIVEEPEGQLIQPTDALKLPPDSSTLPASDKQVGLEGDEKEPETAVPGVSVPAQPPPRTGGYGYANYASPYKYVRPGAAPLYGAGTASGAAPGRGVPLKGIGGRGDWRGSGRGTFGTQPTSQSSAWPPQSGFEYTLPPSMTVFDIDLEAFEEKPWKQTTADISDFFNFGFNETTWKDYCKQLTQLRLESTMQSKIRVYESGRSEQEYDPDLPPELAVAAGLQEPGERSQHRSLESEAAAASTMGRRGHTPIIPLGRPIEVEGGLGDRKPSSDLRKQRIRDSDSIILVDAMEEEDIEERVLDEREKGRIGDEADREEQIGEEEEYERQVGDNNKGAFKGRPKQQTWHKEEEIDSKIEISSKGTNILMENAQKVTETRTKSGFQVHPLTGKSVTAESGKNSGESISASHRETSRAQTAPRPPLEGRRGTYQNVENNEKDLTDDGGFIGKVHIKDEYLQNQQSNIGRDGRSFEKLQIERIIDRSTTSMENKKLQAESPEYSSKRQRLDSPQASHTASWDDYEIRKSSRNVISRKEQRDSGETARSGREDSSQFRKKHLNYAEASKGSQHRDVAEGLLSDSYNKKQASSVYRADTEHEVVSETDNETRKRQKPTGKEASKEAPRHWKGRDEISHVKSKESEVAAGRWDSADKDLPPHYKEKLESRSESRRKEEEEREITYHKDREAQSKSRRKADEDKDRGNWPEIRKKEEDRRERLDSRKKYIDDRKDISDKGYQHKGREIEASGRSSSERRREDDHRRKDFSEEPGGHDKKEREKHSSEKYDRDTDQHSRRKDEWKRDRLQDSYKSKPHGGSSRERESRQPKGDYQDHHRRSSKDEEKPVEAGRSSRRHDDDKSSHGKEDDNASDARRSREHRRNVKDKRKDSDDQGKEKVRGHEGRSKTHSDKESVHSLDGREKDSGKYGRASDDQKTSERRSHPDKHNSDGKRSKDSEKEGHDSTSQFGDHSNANRKRKNAIDKNASVDDAKEEYHDSRSMKVSKVKDFEAGSSDEDEQQKGRSKLERWMSHKDSDFLNSERLSHEKIRREDKHRNSANSQGKQRHTFSNSHDEKQDGHEVLPRNRKGNASNEQTNGQLPEEGITVITKGPLIETQEKRRGEDHERQEHSSLEMNIAVKLEKRKERFKVSAEDNELGKKLDQEDHKQRDNDGSRQERPPRKRRWASG